MDAAPLQTDGRRGKATAGRRWDPRVYQIATLGGLLVYGLGWLGFDLPASHVVAILVTVLLVQLAGTRLSGRPLFDPKSALISGLSLCLLLRTNSLELAVVTGAIAIASKFVVRVQGKHVFNPTNLALVASTTSSSCRPRKAAGSRRGCATTAIASPPAPRGCWAAI